MLGLSESDSQQPLMFTPGRQEPSKSGHEPILSCLLLSKGAFLKDRIFQSEEKTDTEPLAIKEHN